MYIFVDDWRWWVAGWSPGSGRRVNRHGESCAHVIQCSATFSVIRNRYTRCQIGLHHLQSARQPNSFTCVFVCVCGIGATVLHAHVLSAAIENVSAKSALFGCCFALVLADCHPYFHGSNVHTIFWGHFWQCVACIRVWSVRGFY